MPSFPAIKVQFASKVTEKGRSMEYKPRIADELLKYALEYFGATLIKGPKGCEETTTAKQHAHIVIEFQDEDVRDNLITIANTVPNRLLKGEKPILFDERQDATKN